MTVFGWAFPWEVLLLGVLTGLTYGLLAVGLVLVYRSSKFINFAHGEIGAFGAAFLGLFAGRFGWPYWIAFLVAIAVSAGVGGLTEGVLLRRLHAAPKLVSMVASLVLAQFLTVFALVINAQALSGTVFPQPTFFGQDLTVVRDTITIQPAYFAMAVLAPIVMVALFAFLRRSRFGIAIRAAAANEDAAAMAGISPRFMSTMTWALAGGIAAFTASLVLPTRGLVIGQAFGLSLLLPALAAAVVARMRNLPLAFGVGIGAGLVERLISFNTGSDGMVRMVLFVVILVALLLQNREGSRARETGSWLSVESWPRLPDAVRDLPEMRGLRVAGAVLGFTGLLVLGQLVSNETAFVLIQVLAIGIVGLSIGFLTGLNGQLSLGQFAIAGFGAVASYVVGRQIGDFTLGIMAGAAFGGVVSVLIGIPALRVRGLLLAVVTLAFALASQSYLLQQSWLLGDGIAPGRPLFGNREFDLATEYYYVVVLALAVALWVMNNLRRSGFGRSLVALRDNEDNARAFGVFQVRRTLVAYAVAGAFAGLGGAAYGHSISSLDDAFFTADISISVVIMAVVGGIGVLIGPLLGALYVIGVPSLFDLDFAGAALHAFGLLLVVLLAPGGIVGMFRGLRDRVVGAIAAKHGLSIDARDDQASPRSAIDDARQGPRRVVQAKRTRLVQDGAPLLTVTNVSKHYGGVTAVAGVTMHVRQGQTIGLVGPNGAGKTTLFEIISGFVTPDTGTVHFGGHDVTAFGPERRAGLGLVRSFQEAALFPTMTLLETVMTAHERLAPSSLLAGTVGLRGNEWAKEAHARDLIDVMGLDRFRDTKIGALSTGTRRIAELTCVLALEPELLLLDEPAAGVAQRETEALGELLTNVKKQLGTTMIVIEHDIPLLAEMSDWLVAMESGAVLVEGIPDEVQKTDLVIDSFLGGDPTAIARSGAVSPNGGVATNELQTT